MDPAIRDTLAWGLVGGLSFLVLVQGYELVTAQAIAALVKVAGAVVVTAAAAAGVVALRRRLPAPTTAADPAGAANEGPDESAGGDRAEAATNERT